MANKIADKLGLVKQKDQTWLDESSEWKVVKIQKGYFVSHIPTGKVQSCVGVNTLASAKSIMKQEFLNNNSYFR